MKRDPLYFYRLPRWRLTLWLLLLFAVALHAQKTVGAKSGIANGFAGLEQPAQKSLGDGAIFPMDKECRLIHSFSDQCAFVRKNCGDEEAGLFSYLQLYYCRLPNAKPVAFIIMILWLGILFSTIGITASEFFTPNLSTIATLLGLSESMAGVTFLAFGNGSPDVFSTFAAMSTQSGSLAVGELVGAAGFITAVVAGSMAVVRPFKVTKKSFVRDVGFFIIAASFSMLFLADGHLQLWECAVMVAFYVFYVIIVMVWHWFYTKRQRWGEREGHARGHFIVTDAAETMDPSEPHEEVGHARRYRGNSSHTTLEDFGALEAGNRSPRPGLEEEMGDVEDDDSRDRVLAEINRNMRVVRPSPGHRQNAGNPIRPSLLGAVEFRAVLASLERSRNQHAAPIDLRRYSDDPNFTLNQQRLNLPSGKRHAPQYTDADADDVGWEPYQDEERMRRTRAVSANEPRTPQVSRKVLEIPRIDLLGATPPASARAEATINTPPVIKTPKLDLPSSSSNDRLVSSPICYAKDSQARAGASRAGSSNLLVPPSAESLVLSENDPNDGRFDSSIDSPSHSEALPKPVSRRSTGSSWLNSAITTGSSPATPFPPYQDDPNASIPSTRPPSIRLPPPSISTEAIFGRYDLDAPPPKRIRWWPYRVLPPPSVLAATLFPTIHSWREKNIVEKLLGLISAPSVFLLTITLPVVEVEKADDTIGEIADQIVDHPALSPISPLASTGGGQNIQEEAYESETRNTAQEASDAEGNGGNDLLSAERQPARSISAQGEDRPPTDIVSSVSPPSSRDWNRWLVSTQVFMAPLFVTLIIWANSDDNLSPRTLFVSVAYALIASLSALGILLITTTEAKPPRYRTLLCFLGFVVSIAWISTIAGEVVGVLKAFGVILGISDAILGLTVFAVGNSLGDLVANTTVAKLGFPVMALSACFGGPMLNILLGIGVSGMYLAIQKGSSHHSGSSAEHTPYHIDIGTNLIISGITLLVTLVGLLIAVPLNKWIMDRKIGWGLIILWSASTIVNVAMEITGAAGTFA